MIQNEDFVPEAPLKFFEIPNAKESYEQNLENDLDGSLKIGSPGQQSDEGILTKESSQDDTLTSMLAKPKFHCDSFEE